jgi:hypothetical protein
MNARPKSRSRRKAPSFLPASKSAFSSLLQFGQYAPEAERLAPQAHQLWQREVLIRIGNGLLDGHFGESEAVRRVAKASPPTAEPCPAD